MVGGGIFLDFYLRKLETPELRGRVGTGLPQQDWNCVRWRHFLGHQKGAHAHFLPQTWQNNALLPVGPGPSGLQRVICIY